MTRDDPARTGISVIMPAYRESASIARSALAAAEWLAERGWPFEVIVVDDGSDDGTSVAAAEAARGRQGIRVIRHEVNRGYGAALRTGIAAATHGLVLLTDADGQCPIGGIDELLPGLATHDVVVGVRRNRADGPLRDATSLGYNLFLRLLFGLANKDANCPMKLWRRADLVRLPLRSDRFFAPAEMLLLAGESGLSVTERPVDHKPRAGGRSSVSLRETRLMIADAVRYRFMPTPAPFAAPSETEFDAWNERIASGYDHDAYFTSPNGMIRITGQGRLRAILKRIAAKPGDRVLDIGCGDGVMLAALPPCRKTGIDLATSSIRVTQQRLGAGAVLMKMNAEALQFPDGSFDKIICSEVLEHTLNPRRVLSEIGRVLAPGGTAVASVPNERLIKLAKRWSARFGRDEMLSMGSGRSLMPVRNPWHIHEPDLRMLRSWVPAGLRIAHVDRVPSRLLPLHYVVTLVHAQER